MAVDSGNGGAMDWPEFSIPDDGHPGAAPERAAGETGSPTPTAAAGEPAQAPGTEAQAAGGPRSGDDHIPKYRLDEVTARLTAQEETNRRLLAMLEQRQAPLAQPAAPAGPVDPDAEKKQKILQQLIALDPRFGKMLEYADRLPEFAASAETLAARQAREKADWDRYATTTLSTVHDAFAKALSDGKKGGADLPRETRQRVTNNFVAWIMEDETQGRAQRYDSRDGTLVQEFVADWKKSLIDPWRRQEAAGQVQEARRQSKLPVSGGTASPLGTPTPKPKADDDEDAIYKRAWQATRQEMEQTS
jgi:hypothetical protein